MQFEEGQYIGIGRDGQINWVGRIEIIFNDGRCNVLIMDDDLPLNHIRLIVFDLRTLAWEEDDLLVILFADELPPDSYSPRVSIMSVRLYMRRWKRINDIILNGLKK